MNRILLILIFPGLVVGSFAGGLGDPSPPVTKHIEIAGTLTIGDGGDLILKSNGHEYLLTLDPAEPGVASLKKGMALIVKGTVTITDGTGTEKVRTLRPDEIILRGRSFLYSDPPAP